MMRRQTWTLVVSIILALAFAGVAGAQDKKAATPPAKTAGKTQLIDLNSATKDELKTLPGIGDVTAQKIIDNRPYQNKSQLVSKKIVSQSVYDKISGQIIAKQPTTASKKKGG